MPKDIYLIRHGQTLYNLQKRVQGRGIDSSLNALGLQQAKAFYEHYHAENFQLVYTSSLKRTTETVASFLAEDIPHIIMPELDEISWGVFEGKHPTTAMTAAHQSVRAAWGAGKYGAKIKNGENAQEVVDRLAVFVQHLKEQPEDKILVCAHGGSLAFLMTIFQNQPISAMVQYKHHNTGLCQFYFDDSTFQLKLQDNIQHLEIRDIASH